MLSSDIAANASQLVPEVLFESFLFMTICWWGHKSDFFKKSGLSE